jgi:hypothetical protein
MTSGILTGVTIKSTIVWNVTSCSLVEVRRLWEESIASNFRAEEEQANSKILLLARLFLRP